jgi:hypothetical protein
MICLRKKVESDGLKIMEHEPARAGEARAQTMNWRKAENESIAALVHDQSRQLLTDHLLSDGAAKQLLKAPVRVCL